MVYGFKELKRKENNIRSNIPKQWKHKIMIMSFDMKMYWSKISYETPNNTKITTLIEYVCCDSNDQMKIHLPLCMNIWFVIFLRIAIVASKKWNKSLCIESIRTIST